MTLVSALVKHGKFPSGHREVKFGRRPRRVQLGMRAHAADYLQHMAVMRLPVVCDYSPKALPELEDIYCNDQVGDCVIAAAYHLLAVQTGNSAGNPFHATSEQIIADYSAISGYNPADPSTDVGCNEETAFAHWRSHGFADKSKVMGWLYVNAHDPWEMKKCQWLFENLFFGLSLPDAWVNNMPSGDGFVWDVAGPPVPTNGHAVIGVGYTEKGILIDTWGMIGTITWAAVAQYAGGPDGQLFSLLTTDQIARSQTRSPQGLPWAILISDFDALGGNVPKTTPVP